MIVIGGRYFFTESVFVGACKIQFDQFGIMQYFMRLVSHVLCKFL